MNIDDDGHDDKIRHDSYESAPTNNSESRSASFTEYSTTSSQSNTLVRQPYDDTINDRNETSGNSLSPSSNVAIAQSQLTTTRPTPVPIITNNNNLQQQEVQLLSTTAGNKIELTCESHGGRPAAEVCFKTCTIFSIISFKSMIIDFTILNKSLIRLPVFFILVTKDEPK